MERRVDHAGQIHSSARELISDGFVNDPGLTQTSVCNSSITWLNGLEGELRYRGYAINELASKHNFNEVMYLLLHGELPNSAELAQFKEKIKSSLTLSRNLIAISELMPATAHPMAVISTLLSNCCANQQITRSMLKSPEARYTAAMHILSVMPIYTIIAAQKLAGSNYQIHEDAVIDIHVLTEGLTQTKLPKDHVFVRAIDKILTLHADHELNASTFTMRVTASTNSNPYSCILSALSALWGPAHGGANEACLNMLQEIETVYNIPKFIERAKDKNDPFKLMGFGHRVYKNYDPRAKIMRELCHEVLDASQISSNLFAVAKELEQTSLNDPYFIERKLYPNVDFYSGIMLSAMGIPSSMFTAIFALARTTGWLSHWLEMHERAEYKIFRPRQFYDGIKERSLPDD